MIRTLFLTITFCTLTLALIAEDPKQAELTKKPMYERLLKSDDAKKAAELKKRIANHEAADRYTEAIQTAKDLLALRTNRQGADHHEVSLANYDVIRLQKLAALSAEKRNDYQAAVRASNQPIPNRSEDAARVLPVFQNYADSCQKVFGKNHPETARASIKLAGNLRFMGSYPESQKQYETALEICRTCLGDEHPLTASSYNNLANIFLSQGRMADAEDLLKKTLAIRLKVLGDENANTIAITNKLAGVLDQQGKMIEAKTLHLKALAVARKNYGDNHYVTATCFGSLAIHLSLQGKNAEAYPLQQKALEFLRKRYGDLNAQTASGYDTLGLILQKLGRLVEAEPLLKKALAIRSKIFGVDHPDTAYSINSLAVNYIEQGKIADAQPLLQKSLAIRRKILGDEHPDTARVYNNLALTLQLQGKLAEAQSYFQKCLDIELRAFGEEYYGTATCYFNLAENDMAQGKLVEANEKYVKAMTINRKIFGEGHPYLALIYGGMAANLQHQGMAVDAQTYLENAVMIQRKFLGEEHAETAHSYSQLAMNFHFLKKTDEAEAVLRKAIFSSEASRLTRAQGLERALGSRLNPRLLLAVIEQNKTPAAAWANVEATLARGLLDHLGLAETNLTEEERKQFVQEQDRVTDLQSQILVLLRKTNRTDDENTRLEQFLAARREAGQRLAALAVAASTREVASNVTIQSALPDDAAVLFWVDVTSRSGDVQEHFACVVRSSGDPKWERLPGTGPNGTWSKADTELPEKLRSALAGNSSHPEIEILVEQLHAQRLAPVLKHLNDIKTLYVVPVNEMAGIPIESLTQDFTMSYIPSGTFLARLKNQRKPTGVELLVVGDAIYSDPNFARRKKEDFLITRAEWNDLPGTRVETNRLKQLFGERAKVFTDGNASEQTLESLRKSEELSKYRYLHFATHGEGNNVKAFESSLILSQDNLPKELMPKAGEPFLNGQLSAREVLDYWKLNAELVTLSACETAIGKSGGGDGLLGFAQAFLTAGARSVCLSLWKVDDTATALLMSRFYENLLGKREGLTKPMGKAAALDEAKRWLRGLSQEEALKLSAAISDGVDRGTRGKGVKVNVLPKVEKDEKPFAHPKYWAAFVLIGDPN